VALFLLTLCITAPLLVLIRLPGHLWWRAASLWHRAVLRILGVHVHVVASNGPDSRRLENSNLDSKRPGMTGACSPVLYVANHIGWLDIVILGAHLRNASFVAKSEIAGWGAIGKIAALHKTEFVNRDRRSDSGNQANRLAARAAKGDSLILFAEGTSTDGARVAPFKSALFSLAERASEGRARPVLVQPVTLRFVAVDGAPMRRSLRPLVAWIGDMELVDHLKVFFQRRHIVAELHYHPPIDIAAVGGRKQAARQAWVAVEGGLHGR